jgi:hypothetical protein
MRYYLIFLLLLATNSVFCQTIFSSPIPINSEPYSPRNLASGDLDGDGDNDIIVISLEGQNISWFDNEDGLGTIVGANIITTELISVFDDIDNDGDLDIFLTFKDADKIAWYENEDGLGNFGEEQIILQSIADPSSIEIADIDGDSTKLINRVLSN